MIGLEFIRWPAQGNITPISSNDATVLNSVRETLHCYNRLRRFGVALLHDGIALTESEILLETCDPSTRTLHCIVAGREDQRVSGGIETTWSWSAPAELASIDPVPARLCRRQCTKICFTRPAALTSLGGMIPAVTRLDPTKYSIR
jgi:hypothetical protein